MKAQPLSKSGSPTSLHHLMFVLQHMTDELLQSEMKVGLSQVRILSVLNTKVAYSQRGVAIMLRQTEANVSRQLKLMRRHGLVNVKNNPKDKRQKEVVLTSKGKRTFEGAQRLLNAQQKELSRLLSTSEAKAFEHAINNLLASIV